MLEVIMIRGIELAEVFYYPLVDNFFTSFSSIFFNKDLAKWSGQSTLTRAFLQITFPSNVFSSEQLSKIIYLILFFLTKLKKKLYFHNFRCTFHNFICLCNRFFLKRFTRQAAKKEIARKKSTESILLTF